MTDETKQVRLQIPLHKNVYHELEALAERFERPVSWMAREILAIGVEQRRKFIDWLTFRFIGKVLGNKNTDLQLAHLLEDSDAEVIRLQVNVPEELALEIEEQARALVRLPNQMASLLIAWTLDDQGWLAKFVTSRFGKAVTEFVGWRKPRPKTKRKSKAA